MWFLLRIETSWHFLRNLKECVRNNMFRTVLADGQGFPLPLVCFGFGRAL